MGEGLSSSSHPHPTGLQLPGDWGLGTGDREGRLPDQEHRLWRGGAGGVGGWWVGAMRELMVQRRNEVPPPLPRGEDTGHLAKLGGRLGGQRRGVVTPT